jgi:hypothetical protein
MGGMNKSLRNFSHLEVLDVDGRAMSKCLAELSCGIFTGKIRLVTRFIEKVSRSLK